MPNLIFNHRLPLCGLRLGLVTTDLIQFGTDNADVVYPSTFCGWFKVRAHTSGRRFCTWGTAAAQSTIYSLATGAAGVVIIKDERATTDNSRTSTNIPLVINKWHFVAGVWVVDSLVAADSLKIYIGDELTPCREPTYTDVNGVGAVFIPGTSRRWIVGNGTQTPSASAPPQALNADIAFCMLVNRAMSLKDLRDVQSDIWSWQDRTNIFCIPALDGRATRLRNWAKSPRYHNHANLISAGVAASFMMVEGPTQVSNRTKQRWFRAAAAGGGDVNRYVEWIQDDF